MEITAKGGIVMAVIHRRYAELYGNKLPHYEP
jgi:hypothetical protein